MLYPYKFTPNLVERVWGGNALEHYGKSVPPGKRIGESWEISDRDDVQSVISNGPDKGPPPANRSPRRSTFGHEL
jgi:mannose-6-phosphate isomerase